VESGKQASIRIGTLEYGVTQMPKDHVSWSKSCVAAQVHLERRGKPAQVEE
jgi:hypothetical protein